jgi:hypothetical protein
LGILKFCCRSAIGVFDQSLQELNHVKSLLRERDLRFVQSDCEVKNSLTGSFLRAKGKTANKSEASVIKQIDSQAAMIQSIFKSLDDKITDTKERLTRMEGSAVGSGLNRIN